MLPPSSDLAMPFRAASALPRPCVRPDRPRKSRKNAAQIPGAARAAKLAGRSQDCGTHPENAVRYHRPGGAGHSPLDDTIMTARRICRLLPALTQKGARPMILAFCPCLLRASGAGGALSSSFSRRHFLLISKGPSSRPSARPATRSAPGFRP